MIEGCDLKNFWWLFSAGEEGLALLVTMIFAVMLTEDSKPKKIKVYDFNEEDYLGIGS